MHALVRSFAVLAILAVPLAASAAPPTAATSKKPTRVAHVDRAEKTPEGKAGDKARGGKACLESKVEVTTGVESATFALARCDGSPAPTALEQLSILARPPSAAKPKESLDALAKGKGAEVAPGVRRLDARLLERVAKAVEHFRKPGGGARVELVSGYRPRSAGSYHQSGRALDFRIDGVTNEALVAFCKTLPDTGCGYYPNSLFVHMDVRDAGAGHVTWIDVSKPGETPRYVSQWPLPAEPPAVAPGTKLPSLPAEEPGSEPRAGDKVRRDGHTYYF